MSSNSDPNVAALFKKWRSGNAESGTQLAQRISDWFYAICSSRYGEEHGYAVFQTASRKFGEGVVNVAHSEDLVPWAHSVLCTEIIRAGVKPGAANVASGYSGGHPPVDLLAAAKTALPVEVEILRRFFNGEDVAAMGELVDPLGGVPSALLHARYSVKRWLKNEYSLPFDVTPEQPNMDLFPLSMYESNRMKDEAEVSRFEKWMLDNNSLCRDVAEFAPFAAALRMPPSTATQQQTVDVDTPSEHPKGSNKLTNLIFAFGLILVFCSLAAFAFIAAFSWE